MTEEFEGFGGAHFFRGLVEDGGAVHGGQLRVGVEIQVAGLGVKPGH